MRIVPRWISLLLVQMQVIVGYLLLLNILYISPCVNLNQP